LIDPLHLENNAMGTEFKKYRIRILFKSINPKIGPNLTQFPQY